MWDTIKALALSHVATLFLSNLDWETVVRRVCEMANREISGVEKRRLVIAQLTEVGSRVGPALLNFGIEMAVQWMRLRRVQP